MGVQVCPLPTAILSNHTGGFDHYSFVDLTDSMEEFIDHWKRLGLTFDCIYSGFLGSVRQIEIVAGFLDHFGGEQTLAVVDPVMGDNGRLYSSMSPEITRKKKLVGKSRYYHPQLHGSRLFAGRTLPGGNFGRRDQGLAAAPVPDGPPHRHHHQRPRPETEWRDQRHGL